MVGRTEADLAAAPQARRMLEGLGASFVSPESPEAVDGAHDPLFGSHAAAVLRPDRVIFGVVDGSWDLDRLAAELARRLVLR